MVELVTRNVPVDGSSGFESFRIRIRAKTPFVFLLRWWKRKDVSMQNPTTVGDWWECWTLSWTRSKENTADISDEEALVTTDGPPKDGNYKVSQNYNPNTSTKYIYIGNDSSFKLRAYSSTTINSTWSNGNWLWTPLGPRRDTYSAVIPPRAQ